MRALLSSGVFAPRREVTGVGNLVVFDDYGNPLIVVTQLDTGQVVSLSAAGDRDKFHETLRGMGIDAAATRYVAAAEVGGVT